MPITPVDFSQDSATYFAGAGVSLNTDIVAPSTPAPITFGGVVQALLQGLYNLARGAALSVKGVTGNSAAAVADITAGSDGHVLRRAGTALGFGRLAAGAFSTAPGVVTPDMLDNGAARSLLGRSTNSSGARADVAGGGSNTVYKDDGTAIVCSSLTLADVAPSTVLYEVDFSTLANNTLTNGSEVIDGLTWTVANAASLGTFDILNGTGLRMIAGTSLGAASTFTSTSQAAPHLYLPLSSLPNFDGRHGRLIIEVYCSAITHEASGEGVFCGIWGPTAAPHSTSAARVRTGGIYNGGINRNARAVSQTTVTTPDLNISGHNVVACIADDIGTGAVLTGTWSAGWPAVMAQQASHVSATAVADPLLSTGSRLVLGCSVANDASPTTAFTVQRLRVRRG